MVEMYKVDCFLIAGEEDEGDEREEGRGVRNTTGRVTAFIQAGDGDVIECSRRHEPRLCSISHISSLNGRWRVQPPSASDHIMSRPMHEDSKHHPRLKTLNEQSDKMNNGKAISYCT